MERATAWSAVAREGRGASLAGTSGEAPAGGPARTAHARARPDHGAGFSACLRRGLLGGTLLLALGCGSSSTTGPKASGLIIDAQQLLPDGGGCRLKVTLENRVGTDISVGQLGYNLLSTTKVTIGSAIVFPIVPDGETRSATSDLLVATADGHRLACSEIASFQVNPTLTTVPLASG